MIEYILKTLAPKLFKAIQPLLNQAFPKLLENNLQVILEKVKSELRQEEIQNEAKLKARGVLLAFNEVKNAPFPIAKLALQQALPNSSSIELENAVKSIQSANISRDDIDPNFISKDIDWFREFIKLSGKFSNEDAHKLWGKILETEAKQQGCISYRTLAILAELTPEECKAFQSLFPYIVDKAYIFPEYMGYQSPEYKKFYSKILLPLEESGLIKFASSPMSITISYNIGLYLDGFTLRTFSHSLTVYRNKVNKYKHYMTDFPNLRSINLTQVGKELYLALRGEILSEDDSQKSKQYLEKIATYIESQVPNIEWKIFPPDEHN